MEYDMNRKVVDTNITIRSQHWFVLLIVTWSVNCVLHWYQSKITEAVFWSVAACIAALIISTDYRGRYFQIVDRIQRIVVAAGLIFIQVSDMWFETAQTKEGFDWLIDIMSRLLALFFVFRWGQCPRCKRFVSPKEGVCRFCQNELHMERREELQKT